MKIQSKTTTIKASINLKELQALLLEKKLITKNQSISRVLSGCKEITLFLIEATKNESSDHVIELNRTFTKEEEKILNTKTIEDLDLSIRAKNCLVAAKITSLSQLVSYPLADLMKFRNFGMKSLTEIEQAVTELGLTFA